MTPAILGLSHVGLSVRDRDAARRFWVEVLGFELIDEQPHYCFVFDRCNGPRHHDDRPRPDGVGRL